MYLVRIASVGPCSVFQRLGTIQLELYDLDTHLSLHFVYVIPTTEGHVFTDGRFPILHVRDHEILPRRGVERPVAPILLQCHWKYKSSIGKIAARKNFFCEAFKNSEL